MLCFARALRRQASSRAAQTWPELGDVASQTSSWSLAQLTAAADSVSMTDVAAAEKLSNIALDATERDAMRLSMARMLSFFAHIQSVDTQGAQPMHSIAQYYSQPMPLASDTPDAPLAQADVLGNSSAARGAYFAVLGQAESD